MCSSDLFAAFRSTLSAASIPPMPYRNLLSPIFSFRPTVLVKDFNMKQTGEAAWLRWEDILNEEKIGDKRFRYGIGGMDAADSVDLNAAKCLCMKPESLISDFFFIENILPP